MDRHNATTDLFTLIGMMATVAGILVCLFFLFTPASFGAIEASPMIDRSSDLHLSMRWIQPILGQGIVEDAVIRQRSSEALAAVSMDGISKPAAGSVQWVLGRVIVELNRSRVISGPSNRPSDDAAIVTIVRHTAERFQQGLAAEVPKTAHLPQPHHLSF